VKAPRAGSRRALGQKIGPPVTEVLLGWKHALTGAHPQRWITSVAAAVHKPISKLSMLQVFYT
jgi:hypothetical protein